MHLLGQFCFGGEWQWDEEVIAASLFKEVEDKAESMV